MASASDIAALRLLIAEPDETSYTDIALGARLDAAGASQYSVAYDIWLEKAAATAELVDVSEGGSTRKMGDIYEQALGMAETMRIRAISASQPPTGSGAGTRVKRLVRD
jgi:hypothetical protein